MAPKLSKANGEIPMGNLADASISQTLANHKKAAVLSWQSQKKAFDDSDCLNLDVQPPDAKPIQGIIDLPQQYIPGKNP